MKKMILIFSFLLISFNFCSCGASNSSVSTAENPGGKNLSTKQTAANPADSINQYISYRLPDTLSDGGYNKELGFLGGNLFCLKSTGSCAAKKASDTTPPGWNSYGGAEIYDNLDCKFEKGQLIDVSPPWNHAEYLTKMEPLEHCEVPAAIVQVSFDLYSASEASEKNIVDKNALNSTMWYVFFSKEDCGINYAIFLNAEQFSREDTVTLAQSVKFSDQAFNLKIPQSS
ncbi:hypothetical protein CAFE_17130 [Caprobacter fermentans]|uniref:Uncharacterized protein n=1 Tax=Caproicibacter fermentans TaxID=2576756 RepID=A0A6N8HYU2_9FIRM|nr:hypothetical protein [Caproicibacter fermentans]OCN01710.1 hypothetical protein A7X67_01045 [Clostridium sp. W14A]